MRRFTSLLQNINKKLDLPQPARSRIILEIAADLEDLYQVYRGQGMDEKQAEQKTQEKMDLTDEALAELVKIHESSFRRWMDRISEQARTRWERILLVCMIVFIAAISMQALTTTEILRQTSQFVWPIIGIGFLAIALSIPKFYSLYIKKDHSVKRIHKGLPLLLFLGLGNCAFGMLGYYIELGLSGSRSMFAGSMNILCIRLDADPKRISDIAAWLIRSSSMIMICMLLTMLIGLIWFVLWNKVQKIELAESEIVLKDE
jgi:hypothetical protein